MVSLPEKELRKFVGAYRRTEGLEEGFIVKVLLDKGRPVLVDHFGREMPLLPMSSTKFIPRASKTGGTVVFSSKDGKVRMLTIEKERQSKERYESVDLARPTRDQLNAFVGSFYSPELLTTYRISVENNRLWLQINHRGREELVPTVPGELVPKQRLSTDEGRVFQFSRFEKGKAMQLRARLWRHDAVLVRVKEE